MVPDRCTLRPSGAPLPATSACEPHCNTPQEFAAGALPPKFQQSVQALAADIANQAPRNSPPPLSESFPLSKLNIKRPNAGLNVVPQRSIV
jgi:hypothetical protein